MYKPKAGDEVTFTGAASRNRATVYRVAGVEEYRVTITTSAAPYGGVFTYRLTRTEFDALGARAVEAAAGPNG